MWGFFWRVWASCGLCGTPRCVLLQWTRSAMLSQPGQQALLPLGMAFAELGFAGLALLPWKSAHGKVRKGGTVPCIAVRGLAGPAPCRVHRASASLGKGGLSSRACSCSWGLNDAKVCASAEGLQLGSCVAGASPQAAARGQRGVRHSSHSALHWEPVCSSELCWV